MLIGILTVSMPLPIDDDATTVSYDSIHDDDDIHLAKTPAAVFWRTDKTQPFQFISHEPKTTDHVFLDIRLEAEVNTAFIKITANIAFRNKRHKSNCFLFIYPENIDTLAHVDNDDDISALAAERLGTRVTLLRFTMTTPPSLVVPKDCSWVPKNAAARSTLESLQTVSQQTSIGVAFPSTAVNKDRLAVLCQKVSSRGCLKTTPNLANLTKLYGGQGGIVAGEEVLSAAGPSTTSANAIDELAADGNVEVSPPSYAELHGSSATQPPPGKKRRRLSDDNGNDVAVCPSHEKASLEDICRHGFMEIGRRFDRIEQTLANLSVRLERVEKLVHERQSAAEVSTKSGSSGDQWRESDLGERIDRVDERVTDVEIKLTAGLENAARDLDNAIYDVQHEFSDTIEVRVGDEMAVAQGELEDFVKDEVRNVAAEVEELVKEKMRDALS